MARKEPASIEVNEKEDVVVLYSWWWGLDIKPIKTEDTVQQELQGAVEDASQEMPNYIAN